VKLAARLRAHATTLLVVVVALAAFSFLAVEDRTARHAAGIDDTCAWLQMQEQMFPMQRCFSLEEFLEFVGSHRPPDGGRQGRGDDTRACEAMRKAGASSADQPRSGADYVFSLLQSPACDTGGDNPSDEP
jgi:hypothetical protein